MAAHAVNQLQLAPLGAGDLIDRTVRLYRRHFMALVRASAPPVVVSSTGAIIWSIGVGAFGATGNERRLVVYFLLAAVGILIWFVGFVSQLLVIGGASRNLVMHLLRDEPVTARSIYRSVRSRFWGLLGATLLVVFWVAVSSGVAALAWFLVTMAMLFAAIFFTKVIETLPWLSGAIGLIVYLATAVGALYIFFYLAGRAAYVPQVMLVEGKSVMASVGRSASLARGNARRLMAMFLFTIFATYSALMLLLIPLGWVGYLNGVETFTLDASRWPVWYSIGYQVVWQLSTILLSPVWMLGLSLLYVDERVRHEGYDVELLAAQRFGEMPVLPYGVNAPLAPAVAPQAAPIEELRPHDQKSSGSMLGLFDR